MRSTFTDITSIRQFTGYQYLLTEPNVGLVHVPDSRLDKLGVINKSVKVVPAMVIFQFAHRFAHHI